AADFGRFEIIDTFVELIDCLIEGDDALVDRRLVGGGEIFGCRSVPVSDILRSQGVRACGSGRPCDRDSGRKRRCTAGDCDLREIVAPVTRFMPSTTETSTSSTSGGGAAKTAKA